VATLCRAATAIVATGLRLLLLDLQLGVAHQLYPLGHFCLEEGYKCRYEVSAGVAGADEFHYRAARWVGRQLSGCWNCDG
jgi:hypothetical protein